MNQSPQINRRAHERFVLQPGYTGVAVRIHPDETEFNLDGHAYDISEAGICFELDRPIDAGYTVSLRLDLPLNAGDTGPGRSVFVTGNIVWCEYEGPGASRMAMAITRYDREGDKARMMRALTSKRYLRAA